MPAAAASTETATYSATTIIPVPPASHFAGSGGGDGWAVALSSTAAYNVFHHSQTLQLACHLQSTSAPCFSPETITDAKSHNFSTSGQPGMYLDQRTGYLYVYATRTSDDTAGVVCINTTIATAVKDPYCGFTPLTPVGGAPLTPGDISGTSDPMLVGTRWYAFNFVNGVGRSGAENELLCFSVSRDEACSGQPYALSLGTGTVTDPGFPSPATAVIAGKIIVPMEIEGADRLACFDTATEGNCGGSWPTTLSGSGYAGHRGAPFPLMNQSGEVTGLCIPTGADECLNLKGEEVATPTAMSTVVEASSPWNGPAFVLGPRVYLPNAEGEAGGQVECFDYATEASCPGFPKTFEGLGSLYTVNADPQRPTCIWVNSDHGEHQIQNFDAYTGQACSEGAIRALAAQFLVPKPQCTPASYVSLQILKPARSSYAAGSVAFDDGDGKPIPGLEAKALNGAGAVSLAGLELNTPTGAPQFLLSFSGVSGTLGTVEVKLSWSGDYNASCVGEKMTVVRDPTPVPHPEKPSTTKTKTTAPTPTQSKAKTKPKTKQAGLCGQAELELVQVAVAGSKVRLSGRAQSSLVGRHIDIRLLATGATVAGAVVQRDGAFTATAPLPPRRIRTTNLARYQASTGTVRSLPLKLYRRMYMTGVHVSDGHALLSGRVSGAFRPGAKVALHARLDCSKETVIASTALSGDGTFSASVALPKGYNASTTTFRASTTVLWGRHPELTYTLPTPAVGG